MEVSFPLIQTDIAIAEFPDGVKVNAFGTAKGQYELTVYKDGVLFDAEFGVPAESAVAALEAHAEHHALTLLSKEGIT